LKGKNVKMKYETAWKIQKMIDDVYYRFHNGITFTQSKIFNSDNIWKTYLISDTHFNHYPKTWNWPARPKGWEQMIIDNWNKIVPKNGIVIHLGDFGFGDRKKIKKSRNKLNGEIFLLKGNHDRHGDQWYKDVGINLIKKSFAVQTSEEIFVFSHRPILEEIPKGMVNIHGHVHEKREFLTDKHVNMSVEAIGFKPIKFMELVADWRIYNLEQ
jgi:calcineurin-like phosphoesterase family protein